MSRRGWKTAAEAMAEFEKDPAFVERRRRLDEEWRQKEEAAAREEAPVVKDLRNAGVPINSVWDLVNSVNPYTQSFPILLDHLQRPYSDGAREGIARAMGEPAAKFAWTALVKLYEQEQGKTKDGLAVALSRIADDETLDELIRLVQDPQHGESRIFLLRALERSKLPNARKLLMDLRSDPQLHKEIQAIFRRINRAKK